VRARQDRRRGILRAPPLPGARSRAPQRRFPDADRPGSGGGAADRRSGRLHLLRPADGRLHRPGGARGRAIVEASRIRTRSHAERLPPPISRLLCRAARAEARRDAGGAWYDLEESCS
jgi:hypothetical protein